MLFAHLLEFQALVVPSNQIQNTQHTLNAVQTQPVSQHTHMITLMLPMEDLGSLCTCA